MNRIVISLALFALVGCKKEESTSKPNPEFEKKWAELEKNADPAFIENQAGGAGLLGEVRRSIDPPSDGKSAMVGELKGELPDPEVVRVIRANLPEVKACYRLEEHNAAVGSGKAIVTLSIDRTGTVSSVQVDAPAFSFSKLPACLSQHARAWTFPRFTQGPKMFSYPFVFVGG